MMQVADVAVAVGNALPEVKAIAHEVIGTNTSNAVARYILSDYR
jgi:hydroxymethylpyrimidine pyrophosphatase-like HAD family hydrolase